MDRITKSLVSQFIEENGLSSLPEDKAFEHFTAYLITSEHFTDSFLTEDIVVGQGSEFRGQVIPITNFKKIELSSSIFNFEFQPLI